MRCKRSFFTVGLLNVLMVFSGSAGGTPAMDDATVFAVFDQANTADIWIGRLGAKYGHADEVRQLAGMVATEHEAVQQMGRELAKKLRMVPTPPAGDGSAEKLAKTIALLQSKSGTAFDEAYLRHEIAFHQSVIDAVKDTLLPAIKNGELKALVVKLLPGFEHHLAATKAAALKLGIP